MIHVTIKPCVASGMVLYSTAFSCGCTHGCNHDEDTFSRREKREKRNVSRRRFALLRYGGLKDIAVERKVRAPWSLVSPKRELRREKRDLKREERREKSEERSREERKATWVGVCVCVNASASFCSGMPSTFGIFS